MIEAPARPMKVTLKYEIKGANQMKVRGKVKSHVAKDEIPKGPSCKKSSRRG